MTNLSTSATQALVDIQPQPSADVAIEIRGLTKVFHPMKLRLRSFRAIRRQPPVCALKDFTLTVRRGEVLGLLGTNGAGKTTLLKILSTLVLPTAGRVTVLGQDIVLDAGQVREVVGLVTSDERSFYWRLTGRQNLEFFAAFQGLTKQATCARIEELRQQLGLEALDRRFALCSTGMRHRLAIARALLRQPAILLLDEPTRSLDPLARAALHRLIRDTLVEELGCTVVLATHDLAEAEALCDRLVILHQGRLLAGGTVEELRRHGGRAVALAALFEQLVAEETEA
jgi:ABC-2 type transport system ATP-binding protein